MNENLWITKPWHWEQSILILASNLMVTESKMSSPAKHCGILKATPGSGRSCCNSPVTPGSSTEQGPSVKDLTHFWLSAQRWKEVGTSQGGLCLGRAKSCCGPLCFSPLLGEDSKSPVSNRMCLGTATPMGLGEAVLLSRLPFSAQKGSLIKNNDYTILLWELKYIQRA